VDHQVRDIQKTTYSKGGTRITTLAPEECPYIYSSLIKDKQKCINAGAVKKLLSILGLGIMVALNCTSED